MEKNKIIVALDGMDFFKAINLIRDTYNHVAGFKLNDLLYSKRVHSICEEIKIREKLLFVDPKFYDIPYTMTNKIKRIIAEFGADIITVHCDAEYSPLTHFAKYLAGVTILTSKRHSMFCTYDKTIPETIQDMAKFAQVNDYGYIVCSGLELGWISDMEIKKIVPGVRPVWCDVNNDDQKRVVTPRDAIVNGADYVVIGRPIYTASIPVDALKRTNEEIWG